MTTVNLHEAETQLSRLVDAAERGETVVIARDGRPAVRLEAVSRADGQWSAEALAYFASAPGEEAAGFTIPGDDLPPAPERDLF